MDGVQLRRVRDVDTIMFIDMDSTRFNIYMVLHIAVIVEYFYAS